MKCEVGRLSSLERTQDIFCQSGVEVGVKLAVNKAEHHMS